MACLLPLEAALFVPLVLVLYLLLHLLLDVVS
jgi:hypothetical protein